MFQGRAGNLLDLDRLIESVNVVPVLDLRVQLAAAQASIAELMAKMHEIEPRLGEPPKTPHNSSLPPS